MYPIDFFWRAEKRFPERVAILSSDGATTFAELGAMVRRAAAVLQVADPTVGSYVCVGCANTPDHLIAILATLAAGKAWVPLNPRNGDPELRRIIDFLSPGLVVVDGDMARRLDGVEVSFLPIDELIGGNGIRADSPAPVARQLHETQAVKFTGGTTGIPKGVKQPLRAWNTNIVTQLHELGLNEDDRYLVAAPLTHGTSTYILPVLAAGGSLIFPSTSHIDDLLDAMAAKEATLLFAPPTLVQALSDAQTHAPRALPRLRYLLYGGAPMRPDQIASAHSAFGHVLATTYGQTEAPQIATYLKPSDLAGDRMLSAGRPTLLTAVAVLGEDGLPLPAGEQGEIAIRGDLVMSGYLHAPEESAKVLVDGWLRTGDVGVLDEDGFLFIRDRLRDVIITGGFNVYPGDVEAVLGEHADIADCSVVGVPDAKWGEAVHAAVQLLPGAALDEAQVLHYVRDALGPVKTPKQLHLFEQLPRTPVGKIQKAAIRDEIVNRLENERS